MNSKVMGSISLAEEKIKGTQWGVTLLLLYSLIQVFSEIGQKNEIYCWKAKQCEFKVSDTDSAHKTFMIVKESLQPKIKTLPYQNNTKGVLRARFYSSMALSCGNTNSFERREPELSIPLTGFLTKKSMAQGNKLTGSQAKAHRGHYNNIRRGPDYVLRWLQNLAALSTWFLVYKNGKCKSYRAMQACT